MMDRYEIYIRKASNRLLKLTLQMDGTPVKIVKTKVFWVGHTKFVRRGYQTKEFLGLRAFLRRPRNF